MPTRTSLLVDGVADPARGRRTLLGVGVNRVRQLVSDRQLLAVRRGENNALMVPADFVQDGKVLKGLPGVLTLLKRRAVQRRRGAALALHRRRPARLAGAGAGREPRHGGQAPRAGTGLLGRCGTWPTSAVLAFCLLGTLPLELWLGVRRLPAAAPAAADAAAGGGGVRGVGPLRDRGRALGRSTPRRRWAWCCRAACRWRSCCSSSSCRPARCSPSRPYAGSSGWPAGRRVSYTALAVVGVRRRPLLLDLVVLRTRVRDPAGVLDGVRDRRGLPAADQRLAHRARHRDLRRGARSSALRLVYAPVEDLLFGFSLVVQTLAWWVWWGGARGQRLARAPRPEQGGHGDGQPATAAARRPGGPAPGSRPPRPRRGSRRTGRTRCGCSRGWSGAAGRCRARPRRRASRVRAISNASRSRTFGGGRDPAAGRRGSRRTGRGPPAAGRPGRGAGPRRRRG